MTLSLWQEERLAPGSLDLVSGSFEVNTGVMVNVLLSHISSHGFGLRETWVRSEGVKEVHWKLDKEVESFSTLSRIV
jgi:hypothetical protein